MHLYKAERIMEAVELYKEEKIKETECEASLAASDNNKVRFVYFKLTL